jgi:serine/threonine protein kinase
MALVAGTTVGPYEIVASIGAGGMGEVYRARDTRLGRDVAIKILPESFAREGDRLHRFEQEARAVAALSHPNILAVFDIGQHNGSPNESGSWETYVTTFPGAAGKWQVSRGGGSEPRWRGDGKEIFYIGPKAMLTAVLTKNEGGFSSGTPTPLFQIRGRAPISSTDIFTYDVTRDGTRFLVNRYVKPEHMTPLTIVLHAGN